MESQLSQQFVGCGNNSKGVMETNWPQIGLNLELGRGSESDYQRVVVVENNKVKPFGGFTILQFQELQLQALIFKYLSAGLPVPNHLLAPIWQSFSSSLADYPTSLGINPMWLETRKGIEQEPWRCRRTDGKKWRCGKEALPHHKYCERHVHRGRHRSRKLVDSNNNDDNNSSQCSSNSSVGLAMTSNPSKRSMVVGSNMTELSISLPENGSSSSSSTVLFPMF